jgi:hypothetical protein
VVAPPTDFSILISHLCCHGPTLRDERLPSVTTNITKPTGMTGGGCAARVTMFEAHRIGLMAARSFGRSCVRNQ